MKDKKKITFKDADEIGANIITLFENEEFDKCILFYNNFKNVITQIPQSQQIIPVELKINSKNNENQNIFYEFEPDETEILEELFEKIFLLKFLKLF